MAITGEAPRRVDRLAPSRALVAAEHHEACPGAAILPHDAAEFIAAGRAEHGGLAGIFSTECRAIAGHDRIRPGEPAVAGDRLEYLKIGILPPCPAVEHAERRAVLQWHDAGERHHVAEQGIAGEGRRKRRLLPPRVSIVFADDPRHPALKPLGDRPRMFLVGERAGRKHPEPLPSLRIDNPVDARTVLEIDIVGRQRVVDPRPCEAAVVAPRHRSCMAAVPHVPDAKHRLAVGKQRRGRVRVIRLGCALCDHDLSLRLLGDIEDRERVLVSLPEGLRLGRRILRSWPSQLRRRDGRTRVGSGRQGDEQQKSGVDGMSRHGTRLPMPTGSRRRHASTGWITWPCTSVRRRSMPLL